MAQNCANISRIYDIKNIKAIKRTREVQLQNKNADRSARLTVLLWAASELESTVAGKLFHTFTILFAKEFVLALLVFCDLYNL